MTVFKHSSLRKEALIDYLMLLVAGWLGVMFCMCFIHGEKYCLTMTIKWQQNLSFLINHLIECYGQM